MPDTNREANPKARMNVGDHITADISPGIKITIIRTDTYYRVTMLDLWGRPIREGRNFPGSDHHQERAARDYAKLLYLDVYVPEHPVTWIVYRSVTNQTYVTHRNPPAQELQLI